MGIQIANCGTRCHRVELNSKMCWGEGTVLVTVGVGVRVSWLDFKGHLMA
jgi:hypothetical protein